MSKLEKVISVRISEKSFDIIDKLMQDKLSPFNLRYYFLLFIQFLPAVLAFRLSDYLKRKSESKASPPHGE